MQREKRENVERHEDRDRGRETGRQKQEAVTPLLCNVRIF